MQSQAEKIALKMCTRSTKAAETGKHIKEIENVFLLLLLRLSSLSSGIAVALVCEYLKIARSFFIFISIGKCISPFYHVTFVNK